MAKLEAKERKKIEAKVKKQKIIKAIADMTKKQKDDQSALDKLKAELKALNGGKTEKSGEKTKKKSKDEKDKKASCDGAKIDAVYDLKKLVAKPTKEEDP